MAYNFKSIRNPIIKRLFEAIFDVASGHDHDGVNSKSVTVGAPGAGTVTNAMMAADAKVGSLAALSTTTKASLQAAINEVDTNADTANTAIGTLASLTTTAKANLVAAINEIDSTANDAASVAALADAAADAAAAAVASAASLTGAQTLTNKHLTSPHLTTPLIEDSDTGITITSADQTNAAPVATIPDIGGAADEFVMKDTAQTLTNKTLTTPKIATTGAIVDAGGDEYLKFVEATTPVTFVQITSGDTGVAPKVQGAGEGNTDLHLLGSGTGNVKVSDGTDPTKILEFELNGATTAKKTTLTVSHTNDRVITLPDATDTLVGKATTDVLTNKSLVTPKITDGDTGVTLTSADQTNAAPTVTIPDIGDAADTFCMVDTAQTLTNKTLTAPLSTDPADTFTIGAHDYAGAALDWNLSGAELLKMIHKPTNASGAVNAIIATATIRPYLFINGTGQDLTVKTAAGTGITIANGKAQLVMSDGTNVIAIAAVTA